MATIDVVRKLGQDKNIENSAKQFIKMVNDRPDALKQTVKNIISQIIDDSTKREVRSNYLALVTEILRKSNPKFPPGQWFETFKEVLPQKGTKFQKRMQRLTNVLLMPVLSRAQIIKNNTLFLKQTAVPFIVDIVQHNECIRLVCYKTLIELVEAEITDEDTFMDSILPLFENLRQYMTSSVDDIYFWTKLGQLYPHVEIPEELKKPVTKDTLLKYKDMLDESHVLLPFIHPIWALFAEIDLTSLMTIAQENWLDSPKNRQMIVMIATAAIPFLGFDELLNFIRNGKFFETALSNKQNSIFTEILGTRLKELIKQGNEISYNTISALLSIEREHSFINKIITEGCSELNDEQTQQLIDSFQEVSFQSLMQLLWVQKHRAAIKDFSIVTTLFKLAAEKAENQTQKEELAKFIGVTMSRITQDRHTWWFLLSGEDLPSSEASHTIENLVQASNQAITGLNAVSQLMHLKNVYEPLTTEFDAFVQFISKIAKEKFEHTKTIHKLLLKKSLGLITAEHVHILANDPESLCVAVKNPALSAAALPFFVGVSNRLPSSFWEKFDEKTSLNFPVSDESAYEILPSILDKCIVKIPKGNEQQNSTQQSNKKNIPELVAKSLFGKLTEEKAIELIETQMKKIVEDENCETGGAGVISELVRSSSATAYTVLLKITELSPSYDKQFAQKNLRQWISDCCESNEIPSDAISSAIYASINHEYNNKAAGKKKAENALYWAQKLIKGFSKEIPRDIFQDLAPKFIETGSRLAATLIRQIAGIQTSKEE